jgi:hypothetical protein
VDRKLTQPLGPHADLAPVFEVCGARGPTFLTASRAVTEVRCVSSFGAAQGARSRYGVIARVPRRGVLAS